MTQLSSTASTCAAQWKMGFIKVFGVIYLAAVCAAQDDEDVTAIPGIPTNKAQPMSTVIPTVYEPPVPTLQLESTWLDVFPSEKVVFNCKIDGSSDWTFTWFRDDQEVQDSDPNVSLPADKSVLTITAATQTYSGQYSCRGHHKTKGVASAPSPPLKLTVNANKPKPTLSRSLNFDKVFPGESVTFTCRVSVSSGWEYLWYHNGTAIPAPNGNTYTIASIDHLNSGQYHCKAKRGKGPFYTEESEKTTLQVSDPPKPSARLVSPWKDVFENETVEFRCEVDSSDWTFSWYRNNQLLQENDVLSLFDEEPSLNVTSITQAYQGGYACEVHLQSRKVSSGLSNTVNITVYENVPKPTLSKSPAFNPMYVGETVNFTCNVDVSSGWEYRWYKDGRFLRDTNKTISIHLDSTKKGKYSCVGTRSETTSTHMSEKIQQDVLEVPVPSVKQLRPWSDVFPSERVNLSCGMNDSSEWIYTWSKDGRLVQAVNTVSFDSNGATLSISSASAAHAGQYNCHGHLKDRSVSRSSNSSLTLTVYDKIPNVTVTRDPDYQLMFSGESVSFSCHINVSSGWEYLWYRDDNFLNSGNTYTIKPIGTTDQGSYKCEAKRGDNFSTNSTHIRLEVQKNKPKPSMTQQPEAVKVYTGESVSFRCKVDLSSGWEYLWYKDGAELSVISSNFDIHNASSLNNGLYECMANRNKTMYNTERSSGRNLDILEIPVPSLKQQTPWLDVFPTESVKLSCGMNGSSDWRYKWSKDGKSVQADNIVSFDSDGTTLSISSASALHSGRYSCSGILKSRSVRSSFSSALTLDVYETKPRVILTQSPSHNVMHTGDSILFNCHINVSSGWEYLWYKDDSLLTESGENYAISSALTRDTGSYKCQTKRGRHTVFHSDQSQVVRLDIQERPKAAIILLTGWSEVFSTDSLVLKCGVQESQDTWNYTWFKEDQAINLPPSEKHTVTPQDDPEQSQYTCRGFRTGRPSYSKTSDQFKTKNLLLKRRVLLSISGCIFFGIIAVFLGCIVLRVIRKPAVDEYKPEEADLFLSMSQLKDRDDAPCPLVEYITDAALNSPPKEGNENGTVCSETTPLPISSQEDQAVTAESHDATENNGGLVSFQQ